MVPDDLLAECMQTAATPYAVEPRWVPAFFSNAHLPWYVGGATFYDTDGAAPQVCFVLREPFRRKRRWLIYDRGEIVSHEACHVARAGLGQERFEESLAYAISASALRRCVGGVFRGGWEAVAILVGAGVLAGGAALELAGLPAWVKLACALPLAGTIGVLTVRGWLTNATLERARRFLEPLFGPSTSAVLFRATDEEIVSLAEADREDTLPRDWVAQRRKDLRWQIITRRFLCDQN